MRLAEASVKKYRSARDTGLFEVEAQKTIMVGPNEAGKTVVLQALQQINAPDGVSGFDELRDYPRSEFNDITTGRVSSEDVEVVEAHFSLDDEDKAVIDEQFHECTYKFIRRLNNKCYHDFIGGPSTPTFAEIEKDLARLAAHADGRIPVAAEGMPEVPKPSALLKELVGTWKHYFQIRGDRATGLSGFLSAILPYIDEDDAKEEARYDKLASATKLAGVRDEALGTLYGRRPVFVLFSNYFRVKPLIHLEHLATRLETNVLDDQYYDYGNECLLRLLGFTARELSDLGKTAEPAAGDAAALQKYRDQLDKRLYQLNAASVRLTEEIRAVWLPDPDRDEADRLRIVADGQYLKVVVEDELGVEIELDQRSEGFQWLVSFFVVFFAETAGKHANAILLLDEPGMSLHALKQRDFRETISKLAAENQTLYTTHSPFLVGPDELDLVRVVEMKNRKIGTKVHTQVTAEDPAALMPLQEALGYDLAQSLFAQQRNLILEGLTDFWYVDAVSRLLRDEKIADLNDKIALVPANSAGKVVYFATILHANKLKVAALLDSDSAGDQAAEQDVLVHTLGNKGILRTKDVYSGPVVKSEIEDLLRETLVRVAKDDLGWDVESTAKSQPDRPIVDVFADEVKDFSKYKLAKAFLRWSRDHDVSDLTGDETAQWKALVEKINKALK